MGSSQSIQIPSEDEQQEEEDEDEDEEHNIQTDRRQMLGDDNLVKKVLEQEPEMLPCHASASPLSPQLSTYGTPRLGPSIKVWDPYNVLAPPPPLPPPPQFSRSFSSSSDAGEDDRTVTEARALAVFLKSQGIQFNSVYTSPLDRARATALSVCQELNFSEERIQSSDALLEMSQGHWEGCHRSEIFTPETMSFMERFQPDFSAPSGESLRQVEFRMVQFLNHTVLALPEKYRSVFSPTRTENRQGLSRKKSGKSRLQIVTTTGDNEADDEMSPRVPINQGLIRDINVRSTSSSASSCVGIFTHSVPIKCLLTGLLGCSPAMSHKICIEDSSVTVLQHTWKLGWQIKRSNDTSHLRLL
ncbi:Phosphoglycerate mutase family protein [Abeliophyllum distichum]|uniref:Phosphoglycerate mutase family protein n=1 Tax=Abeliophyllum distichum TaxID=126358 RepID=A0ABD1URR7_9LAMI